MVASRQVEIPFYRAVGRQRGWGFGALGEVFGKTALPFLRKYVVPANCERISSVAVDKFCVVGNNV